MTATDCSSHAEIGPCRYPLQRSAFEYADQRDHLARPWLRFYSAEKSNSANPAMGRRTFIATSNEMFYEEYMQKVEPGQRHHYEVSHNVLHLNKLRGALPSSLGSTCQPNWHAIAGSWRHRPTKCIYYVSEASGWISATLSHTSLGSCNCRSNFS